MAHLDTDDNANVGVNIPTVSFTLLYDKTDEVLSVQTVKINNLQQERRNEDIAVHFKAKDWSGETQPKTARTADIIWNEKLAGKLKHKHIAEENVHVKVTNGESLEIGAVSVSLKDVNVDEKTVCSLHLDMNQVNRGELVFSIRPTNDGVNLTISKARNLPRVMREYTVLARLLSADDSEKKTTAQKTGIWNEQIVFKDERVVLGEVRVNISDVKQREYGRILALQEPKVDSINFSTTFTQDEASLSTLVFKVFGLENIKPPSSEKTSVYVQVKHKCEGVVVKKEKTSKTELTENPSFKANSFTFKFDNEKRTVTKFVLSVKTQKSAYHRTNLSCKVVIGPISEGSGTENF
ncbi:hypothetical protein BSL78_24077 [Apostichopus japonicus]|uniref:C2 domain-containing protein n=1 Tax=Stichopus japonicus TaxID=307972 RepID=A0A2G8JTK8_STIJA|nr:hypothetical protein BSL78_24077 [Apostichopus japonicus]